MGQVTAEEKQKVYKAFAEGRISDDYEKAFLSRIALPGQKADGTIRYDKIGANLATCEHAVEAHDILAHVVLDVESIHEGSLANNLLRGNQQNIGKAVSEWVKNKSDVDILDPTPVDFKELNDSFVALFSDKGEDGKVYAEALNELKSTVYGKISLIT